MKLIQFLLHRPTWHKLPPMPRQYSTEYDAPQVDRDTAMLMSLTHTRCPQGVELLKRKHGVPSARVLIETLPPRRRRRQLGARALALVRRAMGITAYDPMKEIAHHHMRRGRH